MTQQAVERVLGKLLTDEAFRDRFFETPYYLMPAKSGDLIKSYFVAKRRGASAGVSVAVVVYERLCDLFGLITWCALGWFVARPVVAGVPELLWPLLCLFGAVCGVLISSRRMGQNASISRESFIISSTRCCRLTSSSRPARPV